MRSLTTILIFFIYFTAIAQEKTYYKDDSFSKEVSAKKGKYLKVKFNSEDTTVLRLLRIKDNFLISESKWHSNKPVGVWFQYDLSGRLISKRDFRSLVYSKAPPADMHNSSSMFCDNCTPATFDGGESGMYRYLAMNIEFPKESRSLGNTGTVIISFIISKKGIAKPYSIMRGVDPYIDLEAWKLIEKMPEWSPATADGKPIESYFILPIRYLLN